MYLTLLSLHNVYHFRRQSESFLRCLKENFEPCIGPSPNSILLESLSIVVLQSLQGTQLLCDSSVYQIAWDDLPPLLRKVATCDNDYSAVVADCGRTFRSKFIPVPSPLCEEFENSQKNLASMRQGKHIAPLMFKPCELSRVI